METNPASRSRLTSSITDPKRTLDDDLASPDSTPRAPGRSRTVNNGGDPALDRPGAMGIRDVGRSPAPVTDDPQ